MADTSELQPFEAFPRLAEMVAYMAANVSGVSLSKWDEFLAEINAAIVQSRTSQAEAKAPAVTRETREKAIADLMELSFNNEGFYHYSPRRGCTLSENVCRTIVNVLADRLATAPAPVLTEEERKLRQLCHEVLTCSDFLDETVWKRDAKICVRAFLDRLTQHKPAS